MTASAGTTQHHGSLAAIKCLGEGRDRRQIRSKRWAVITSEPCCRIGAITRAQIDPSAQPPWTSTTLVFGTDMSCFFDLNSQLIGLTCDLSMRIK